MAQWQLRPDLEFTDGIDSWNVRADSNFDSVVLCILQAGHPFTVLDEQGEWLHVCTENQVRGWCYRKFGNKDALIPMNSSSLLEASPPSLQRTLSHEKKISELLTELGERRRLLDATSGSKEKVQAAAAVLKTMAKLEFLGIEKDQLLAADSPEALACIKDLVSDLSNELLRSTSYKHSEFQNPDKESCWLSTFFQSLWHSRVFHSLFESLVRPLPPQ